VSAPQARVEVLRLFDPERRPSNWTGIIRPGQFAAFSKDADTGATRDAAGQPFASSSDVTCLVFDSFDDARTFCDTRVKAASNLRFDIFDSGGRTSPPLLVVVHPSRAHTLAGNQRDMRLRTWIARLLLLGAFPLFWLDYQNRGALMLPTILAINMIVVAARLLHMNMSVKEVERTREERLARLSSENPLQPPPQT
jgi:hypothetical protein